MKIKIIVVLALVAYLGNLSCKREKTLVHYSETYQPDGNNGNDAFIYDLKPDRNLGTHQDFMASVWTNGGIPVIVRSLIKFDFSSIPKDAIIDSVRLSLYSYHSPLNLAHSTVSGSNLALLQRVTSDWDENQVTWNNQPETTIKNQVALSRSQKEIQDYLNIDVTKLAEEMIKNTVSNYGFMLKLETEEYYRSMVFGSSDNDNSNLHPKLVIFYSREE